MRCYINREKALKALGNRTDLYNSVVMKFIDKYNGFSDTIDGLKACQDRDRLYIEAHSLKTIAGTIGAGRLYEKAREVELSVADAGICFEHIDFVQMLDELAICIETLRQASSE